MGKTWNVMAGSLAALTMIVAGCNREKLPQAPLAGESGPPAVTAPPEAEAPRGGTPAPEIASPAAGEKPRQGGEAPESEAASSLDDVARGEARRAEQFSRLPPPGETMFPNLHALLFEAFTENMPPLGTPVTLVLTPRPGAERGEAAKPKDAGEQ